MPLHLIEHDIITMKVDAVVNSTNHHMIGYSGVDRLIHEIGGAQFEDECRALEGKCVPGEAVYTKAYNMDCKYIIHTMSPTWDGGIHGEAAILRSAYRSSLMLAQELDCKSVAFPLLSAGNRLYPVTEALRQATVAISEFLEIYPKMKVYIVLFGETAKAIADLTDGDLTKYVAEQYQAPGKGDKAQDPASVAMSPFPAPPAKLEDLLAAPGEDFLTMMYRFFDERGVVNDASVYNKAHITRAAFNKIKNGHTKKPSLGTAVALAMALELPYDDAVAFLASAGLALSKGSKFDIIVEYYLRHGKYDITALNIQLYNAGLPSIP